MKLYEKLPDQTVNAVQINLDLANGVFQYHKWDNTQTAKQGDWILNNKGEAYTVDQDVFASTYKMVSDGVYAKVSKVLAEEATETGTVETKEGISTYYPGDMIICNEDDPNDRYMISREIFDRMYQPVEG